MRNNSLDSSKYSRNRIVQEKESPEIQLKFDLQ